MNKKEFEEKLKEIDKRLDNIEELLSQISVIKEDPLEKLMNL